MDITNNVREFIAGQSLAELLFEPHRHNLAQIIRRKQIDWVVETEQAAKDLAQWQAESGRAQNYTPQELACARIARNLANEYEQEHKGELALANGIHKASLDVAILENGLGKSMLAEGKAGRKFGIVEISPRLLPCLQFHGSSNYFCIGLAIYSQDARLVLGEQQRKHYVSAEAAQESALNLQRKFGVHYALAETSAAPRTGIAKSRRKPEVFICGRAGDSVQEDHQIIDVPFRDEFDAIVREQMYRAAERMYRVK